MRGEARVIEEVEVEWDCITQTRGGRRASVFVFIAYENSGLRLRRL